jgi:hypothetical protein
MNHSTWRAVILPIVALGVLAAVGIGAYNAGMAHGLAGAAATADPLVGPVQGAPVYAWHGHWGPGFFPIFPIFFGLFFFVALTRVLTGGGPWLRGGWARRDEGVPPMFDEWHRRAHERDAATNGAGTK